VHSTRVISLLGSTSPGVSLGHPYDTEGIVIKDLLDCWSCSYLLIGNVKEARCASWSDEGPGGGWTEVPRVLHEYGNTRGVSKTGNTGTGTVLDFNTLRHTVYLYRGIAGMHGYITAR